jgi:Uma2 family endonuclease
MTVAEFENLPDDGNRHELDEGELIVMPPTGLRHGRVSALVARALDRAIADRQMGAILINCGFRLSAGTVQAPDVAWIREERRSMVTERIGDFAPDLAVEILSPRDNAARLQRKIANYFAAGTSVVWVLDSDLLTVTVYEKPGAFRTLNADDTIDAPALLPGFSARVRTLFE